MADEVSDFVPVLFLGSGVVVFHHGARAGDEAFCVFFFQIGMVVMVDEFRSIVGVNSTKGEDLLVDQSLQRLIGFILSICSKWLGSLSTGCNRP